MAPKAFLLLALLTAVFLIASGATAKDLAEVSNPDEKTAKDLAEVSNPDEKSETTIAISNDVSPQPRRYESQQPSQLPPGYTSPPLPPSYGSPPLPPSYGSPPLTPSYGTPQPPSSLG